MSSVYRYSFIVVYCWGDLGNLIRKPSMIGLRTIIPLKMIRRHTHLYYCLLDKFMKTKINDQPCEDIRKSENKMSWERRRLDRPK
jgi:hypothetical protein